MKSDKPPVHPIIPTEPPPPPPTGRLTLPRLIGWCAVGAVIVFGIAKLAVWIMRGSP